MKKTRPRTVWFVEPGGAHTNRIVSEILNQPEDALERVVCEDGKRHDLWRCGSYSQVRKLLEGQDCFSLRLTVWRKQGDGQVRRFSFDSLPKRGLRGRKKKDRQPLLF